MVLNGPQIRKTSLNIITPIKGAVCDIISPLDAVVFPCMYTKTNRLGRCDVTLRQDVTTPLVLYSATFVVPQV